MFCQIKKYEIMHFEIFALFRKNAIICMINQCPGGGYSGGGSREGVWDTRGGGGGSFNAGTNQQNECCHNTAGHGQVTITFLQL